MLAMRTNVFAIAKNICFTDQHFDDIDDDGRAKQFFRMADEEFPPISIIEEDLFERDSCDNFHDLMIESGV